MGLVSIGPVAISQGNPVFSSDSAPTTNGMDSRTIAGTCSWDALKSLREMIRNPAAARTVRGKPGVVAWLQFDDALLADWTGDYVIERFTTSADQQASLSLTDVPFTLTAWQIGGA